MKLERSPTMSENMQVWFVFGTIALVIVLMYVLLTVIKQKMLAHRLELLAEDYTRLWAFVSLD